MELKKPYAVESDDYRSRKWDEIVAGREFRQSDVPTLTLLVQWYQVVDQCIEDMSVNGGIQVAFANDLGDIKALPQISTMKQASAEIRALNKQLGINDTAGATEDTEARDGGESYLTVIQGRRAERKSASTG